MTAEETLNPDSLLAQLEAYHDGELGWWARQRFSLRLRTSALLRAELDQLETLRGLAREIEPEPRGVGVWRGIEGALDAIDAQIEAEQPHAEDQEATWRWRSAAKRRNLAWWLPGGVMATAVLALWLLLPVTGPAGVAGSVRFLDTDGRSVVVMEEDAGVTIIWMMNDSGDGACAPCARERATRLSGRRAQYFGATHS